MNDLVLIVCIINNGYSDDVIAIAKEKGAKGATILNGQGSVKPGSEKLYGIPVFPEKEILLITVTKKISDEILKEIYLKLGKDEKKQAIAFTMPIKYATSNLIEQYKEE